MEKQRLIEWLINNLQAWPRQKRFAPVVHGWHWVHVGHCVLLVSNKDINDTVTKQEYVKATLAHCDAMGELPAQTGKKILISGPMSGIDGYNRKMFCIAADQLEAEGYVALNPGILPDGLSEPEYMNICIAMLQACDAIYMLNGYDESKGAKAERALAEKLGLDVIYQVGSYE